MQRMSEPFDIQSYMTHGVERVVGDIMKATFRSPKESAYMAKFALANRISGRNVRFSQSANRGKTCRWEALLTHD